MAGVGRDLRGRLLGRLRRIRRGAAGTRPVGGPASPLAPAATPPDEGPQWLHAFDFPAVLAEIPTARRRVAGQAEACGLTGPALFDLLLAVGEALANAVKHGSPRFEADRVRVRVGVLGDAIVVEVHDEGHGFGASRISPPAAFEAGGRGIPFMRALVDELRFELSSDGTRVLLVKRLR